jgi:hypothetical protein
MSPPRSAPPARHVLGLDPRIGLDRILGPGSDRCRDLILALLVGRIVEPASKLATARALSPRHRRIEPRRIARPR